MSYFLLQRDIEPHTFKFFLVIISGIMKISTPFFVLQVFDVAITKLRFDSLIFYTMLIVITTAIGSICEILYQRNISKFNRTLVIKLRSRCFEHINKLSGTLCRTTIVEICLPQCIGT